MPNPRRRIVRPPSLTASPSPQHQARAQKLRQRLDQERSALARWQTRLKRAFNTVQKQQKCIARLERQITQLEES
jgi:septal ring factor EnvC (AmiA/AmiB activator)